LKKLIGPEFWIQGTKVQRFQKLLAEANQTTAPTPAALEPSPVEKPTPAGPVEARNAQVAVRVPPNSAGEDEVVLPPFRRNFVLLAQQLLGVQLPGAVAVVLGPSQHGVAANVTLTFVKEFRQFQRFSSKALDVFHELPAILGFIKFKAVRRLQSNRLHFPSLFFPNEFGF